MNHNIDHDHSNYSNHYNNDNDNNNNNLHVWQNLADNNTYVLFDDILMISEAICCCE
jgi:hypothetical protein